MSQAVGEVDVDSERTAIPGRRQAVRGASGALQGADVSRGRGPRVIQLSSRYDLGVRGIGHRIVDDVVAVRTIHALPRSLRRRIAADENCGRIRWRWRAPPEEHSADNGVRSSGVD